MHRIHPVCEETVSPHVGRPVCLVMRDGTHMYGTLGGCRDGKVYLNECFQGPRLSSVQSKQQLRRVSKRNYHQPEKLNPQLMVATHMAVGTVVMVVMAVTDTELAMTLP